MRFLYVTHYDVVSKVPEAVFSYYVDLFLFTNSRKLLFLLKAIRVPV